MLLIPGQPDSFALFNKCRAGAYFTLYENVRTEISGESVLLDSNSMSSVLVELRSDSTALTILLVSP